jgi:hypothetical protein
MKIFILIFLFTFNLSAMDSLKVVPKESFQMHSIEKNSNDSLVIISCGEFVYHPFGIMTKATQLSSSVLKIFKVHSHYEKRDNWKFLLYKLKYKSSQLFLLFDDNPEASISSYVMKGNIVDSSVIFSNNVRIGMSKAAFLSEFFQSYSDEFTKFNTIIFETCVYGTRQTFSFVNDRLSKVSIVGHGWESIQ